MANEEADTAAALLEAAKSKQHAGDVQQASLLYEQYCKQQPADYWALSELATLYLQQGFGNKALPLLQLAAQNGILDHKLYNNLAICYGTQGKIRNAIHYFHCAYRINKQSKSVLSNLAQMYLQKKRIKAAYRCYQYLDNLESNPAIKEKLASLAFGYKDYQQTINYYAQIEATIADKADRLGQFASACLHEIQFEKAITLLEAAIAIDATRAELWENLGLAYYNLLQHDTALHCFEKALQLKPNHAALNWNKAIIYLQQENFTQGWPYYEYRWQLASRNQHKTSLNLPYWQGQSLEKKSLLLLGEQGIGDELMFLGFIPELLKQAVKITLICRQRLHTLVKNTFPTVCVVTHLDNIATKQFDYMSYTADLMQHFVNDQSQQSFPKQFLFANTKLTQQLREKYLNGTQQKLIGISWRGGAGLEAKNRSIDLIKWLPLLQHKNAQFVSLQYGDHQTEIAEVNQQLDQEIIHDTEIDPLKDFDDFAAQVAAMDHIITIDNSTIHLAAGLGKDCYLMLAHCPDWRWFLDKSESIFYPSVKLFRREPHVALNELWGQIDERLGNL